MTPIDSRAGPNYEPRWKRWPKAAWKWLGGKWDKYLKDPVKVALTILTVLIPLAVVAIGLLIVFDGPHRPQVEASFARVGGLTRTETAADAARFWLHTPARVVETPAVETPATSSGWVMLYAAECAIDEDAPLLFTPPAPRHSHARLSGTSNRVAADLIGRWRASDPVTVTTITAKHLDCYRHYKKSPSSLHTLTANQDVLPGHLGPKPEAGLGKFVIFASSKDPSVRRSGGPGPAADLPDVAVGLALAAHMARDHPKLGGVSLVVLPEYLEADPALENDLRAQKGEVLGGIVLGGPDRISDDTRTLLRQVLRGPDDPSILGGLKGSLGDAAGVIAAIWSCPVFDDT